MFWKKNKTDISIEKANNSNMVRIGFFMSLTGDDEKDCLSPIQQNVINKLHTLRNYEIDEFIELQFKDVKFLPTSTICEANNLDFWNKIQYVFQTIDDRIDEYNEMKYGNSRFGGNQLL